MPIKTSICVQSLEENSKDVYLETTSVLLKLMDNVLSNPSNPKFRSLRLENPTVSNKLLPAIGAMECLFEMGFQEGDGRLILPDNCSLEQIKRVRNEIIARRNMYLKSPPEKKEPVLPSTSVAPRHSPAVVQPETSAQKSRDLQRRSQRTPFLQSLRTSAQAVYRYEDKGLQKRALEVIPLGELEMRAEKKMYDIRRAIKLGGGKEQEIDIRDVLLMELLNWFKNSFFKWVDAPQCCNCQGETKFSGFSDNPNELTETSRVEVYVCMTCGQRTLFPRHNDPERLLETRRGRCGEWANCFTLLCRALGWDARHVVDQTDHVWTEVYSITQRRWLHCDPCENACDTPLMYELGWGKKLTYVLAFSYDDVQDVTWRYSCLHPQVLARRSECSEEELLQLVLQLRQEKQKKLSPARRAFLNRRLLGELVEFLSPRKPDEQEFKGRTSGSLLWKLARGEMGNATEAVVPFVWEPTPAEQEACLMHISYSAAQNRYLRGSLSSDREEIRHWEKGVFQAESIFRKEEMDWNVAYLARTENSNKGIIKWKVDCTKSGLVIDTVSIKCIGTMFETGSMLLMLCDDNYCLRLPSDGSVYETRELSGGTSFILKAELTGGKGDVAWQHAQLFRQELSDTTEQPLNIIVMLRKR